MSRILLFLVFFVCWSSTSFAQSRVLVSQYMYNGLLLNPAYAGSQQLFSLAALYRNQWLNVEGSPTFQMISAHTPIFSNRVGAGFLISSANVGAHKEYGVVGMMAYKLKLPLGYLGLGLSVGIHMRATDYFGLQLLDNTDPFLQGSSWNVAPNFGTGAYFYNGYMYAGFSIPFLLNTERLSIKSAGANSVLRDIRSYYLTAGFLLGKNTFLTWNPSFLLRAREGIPLAADINLNLIFQERLLLGGSYRVNSGFVLLSQLILTRHLRIMYSYDFTTLKLGDRANGTHEIMLNYRLLIYSLVNDPHCSNYF